MPDRDQTVAKFANDARQLGKRFKQLPVLDVDDLAQEALICITQIIDDADGEELTDEFIKAAARRHVSKVVRASMAKKRSPGEPTDSIENMLESGNAVFDALDALQSERDDPYEVVMADDLYQTVGGILPDEHRAVLHEMLSGAGRRVSVKMLTRSTGMSSHHVRAAQENIRTAYCEIDGSIDGYGRPS